VRFKAGHGAALIRLGQEVESSSDRMTRRLADVGAEASPLDRLRAVAAAIIPVDAVTGEAMLVYHAFAGAALTDPGLRSVDAFIQRRSRSLPAWRRPTCC
jgi:hypothetical protein